ncbi:MAG TPA: 1-phosphofructokinase family hexose kinase, partial [Ignavibacteriaceae bacterium]
MIVTVTLNPILERRYSFNGINYPGVNRNGSLTIGAGGKGLNVSRQLNRLGTASLAFTFLGGLNGKLLRDVLKEEDINFTSVKTNSETREGVVLIDEKEGKVTYIFGADREVTTEEADEFREKLEKIIQNCEIVLFSGSSPCSNTDSIFPLGIEAANRYDKISVCDTYGIHLSDCIKAKPTIMHNNLSELEKSLGIELNSEEKILTYLDDLYNSGIKQCYITNAEKTFYSSNFDFHFKIKPPLIQSIDSTGSGDSFVAGIIYGWHKDLTFEEGLKLATALGTANSSRYEVCNITLKEAETLLPAVDVVPIGKKMKTLDVT